MTGTGECSPCSPSFAPYERNDLLGEALDLLGSVGSEWLEVEPGEPEPGEPEELLDHRRRRPGDDLRGRRRALVDPDLQVVDERERLGGAAGPLGGGEDSVAHGRDAL